MAPCASCSGRQGRCPRQCARILERFPGLPFEVTYGMTEVSNIASYQYTGGPLKCASCVGVGPVGTAIRIVDEDDEPIPSGRVGEVGVRSPTAMTGYWRDPPHTAAVLAAGWVHTGDLGYLDAEGYLHVAGRQKDAIVTGGETVQAIEVKTPWLACQPSWKPPSSGCPTPPGARPSPRSSSPARMQA